MRRLCDETVSGQKRSVASRYASLFARLVCNPGYRGAGAELQKVDVAGDGVVPERAGELILISEPQNVFLDKNEY
jgi:hypothetical protein